MNGYRPLPWYKNIFVSTKNKIVEKIKNYKFPWKKLLILVIFALIVLFIYLLVVINRVTVAPREPYNKEGFVGAEEYIKTVGEETILENLNYKFTLDNNNTTFILEDKLSNTSYRSNPDTSQSRFLDTFIVYYAGSLGAEKSMGSYDNAIIQADFHFRVDNNSIEILYEIGGKKGIDSTDFPELMTEERMQEVILSKLEEGSTAYRRVTEQFYDLGDLNGKAVWKLKDGIQVSLFRHLEKIFYEDCGYTKEDLLYDLELNNIAYEDIYAYVELAVKYTLTNDGIDVLLINEAIVEKEKFPLLHIDVLPYFSSAKTIDTGYTLIPDGSGVLIEFNKDSSFALRYNQRIYGKELAKKADVMHPRTQTLNLPLYGMKINDNGFINIAEEGSEMASIIANISTVDNPYNQAYYRYHIREGESFTFDAIASSTIIYKWTDFYNTKDLKLSVKMVNEDQGSYTAMAKKYQEYLIDQGILKNKDSTNKPVLDLTLLGGYLTKDNILGFPYTTIRSLTNPEEALIIVDELKKDGIEDISLFYKGWSNDGLKPTYMGKIYYNSNNGSKKEFRELNEDLLARGINFYPEVMINTAYTNKSLKNKEIIRDVFGKKVIKNDFNEAILYPDFSTLEYYNLKGSSFTKTLNNIVTHFNKQGFKNISFGDFGSNNYGSYEKSNTLFRSNTLASFNEAMQVEDLENLNLVFNNPNFYTLNYASKLTSLPTYGTNYQIVSTNIPFYQLVLSGYLDYSSYSFNTDDSYSINYHKMKAIETLANISMAWSYNSTISLVETEYSYYYSTYYKNWYDTLIEIYSELNGLEIYDTVLVNHELLTANGDIVKSGYENGLEIVFNYTNLAYSYKGINIPTNSYKIVKEAN